MKSGRDATRRNRNIGTARRGHGQDNRLVIPTYQHPELAFYYERLRNYVPVPREVHGRQITFLVEETRADCFHSCTVDDVTHVLRFVPPDDLRGVELIVLRQPKRKEEVLNAAWGRWVPYAVIGGKYRGSAIILEAVPPDKPMRWSKSLTPNAAKELERLEADGHSVSAAGKHHTVSLTLESARATQLYRTLLHEIGHHVDHASDANAFDRKPAHEKEVFAHAYADRLREALRRRGVIPFGRILSPDRIAEDGLLMSDFAAGEKKAPGTGAKRPVVRRSKNGEGRTLREGDN